MLNSSATYNFGNWDRIYSIHRSDGYFLEIIRITLSVISGEVPT